MREREKQQGRAADEFRLNLENRTKNRYPCRMCYLWNCGDTVNTQDMAVVAIHYQPKKKEVQKWNLPL